MYNNTKYAKDRNMVKPGVGYVRVMHTVPDAPNVDIYANDKLVIDNLAFGEYTEYLTVPEGRYTISLYVTGTKDTPVLSNMLTVNKDVMLTIAAAGMLSDIGFLAISDTNTPNNTQNANVRFMHLSPNAPAVDITLPDGTVIFKNVGFQQITPYVSVAPMNYNLQVRVAGTDTVALDVPDVMLQAGGTYTVYAIGLAGGDPPLEALLLMDMDK